MIGIYNDDFIDYLRGKLGDNIKTSSKNIICPCPWCEYNQSKNHYHMYISIEVPIFHCFHAGCEKSGTLKKFLARLEGHDISESFIDKDLLKEITTKREIFKEHEVNNQKIIVPQLNPNKFKSKDMYIKYRLKFTNTPQTSSIKGLIYDVNEFIEINKIPVDQTLFRLREYLHSNFVGFLTENESTIMFRNVDETHSMKFFKLKLQESTFLDYYRLPGNNINSNKIVLAEGIFDIFTENIFDILNLKNTVKLYASALSSKYTSLIYSIIFHEQIFKPEIIILSDRGISKNFYKKMKKYNSHVIDKLTVYYNTSGKDFNDTPLTPVKFNI